MAESPDAQTQLKKRARRRLMGAVALAGLAAVVLPMVMDEEPKQQVQDVQIRIPGQEQSSFKPGSPTAKSTQAEPPASSLDNAASPEHAAAVPAIALPARPPQLLEGASVRPAEKAAEKKAEKSPEKPVKQPLEEAKRATAILSGKPSDATTVNAGTQYVILIGAFSNAANAKQLENKIGEMGIKTYTELLNSSEGKKIRLRAGPFSSRDAADKALDRIKSIGVGGVVSTK
jgi:DedD protein